MANHQLSLLLLVAVVLLCFSSPASAFGAGNIASLSKIEGKNWRHGDIEDMLKTVAFIKGHKWTSMMIKRVYFGNWLRDYSQAVDVGTLKGVQGGTIRILVWVLGFMSFGYATEEFEVTEERLGCYRPEEHIDNPKGYADNEDARKYDPRLRPPVEPVELEIDFNTGMKNYIANESGGWATSVGYIKHSFARSIHFGRMYTSSNSRGKTTDLCEALRCLGQALHTMEDFGAHSNYTELVLREMGYHNVFPHVGSATQINVRGRQIYPLVTGTFGGVDFLHSVIGEATDHVTQSELDEMDDALGMASGANKRGLGSNHEQMDVLGDLLSKIPGTGDLMEQARQLQADSDAEATRGLGGFGGDYSSTRADAQSFQAPPGSVGGPPGPGIPGMTGMAANIDPEAVVKKIYPILVFRDNVVRTVSAIISKIPGLEKLIDTITERVTLFVFSLLAPYLKPVIAAASNSLKTGSSAVVDSSAKAQYEVWNNPRSSDPTHSMLSKDHFSNYLNSPAGMVATAILQYTAPRVLYAWDHPEVPVDQVLNDVVRAFHHPTLRDHNLEIHRNMYAAVERWAHELPNPGMLNDILSSESVKAGKNHRGDGGPGGGAHNHGGGFSTIPGMPSGIPSIPGLGSHSKVSGSPFEMFNRKRELGEFGDTSLGSGEAMGMGTGFGTTEDDWVPGSNYVQGNTVRFEGSVYKCVQSHRADAADWTPAAAPSLWTKVEDYGTSSGYPTGLAPPSQPPPQSYSPQPQWQPGGYENQSFSVTQHPAPVHNDQYSHEIPTNYEQGYYDGPEHNGPGYGGGPPPGQSYAPPGGPYGQYEQGGYQGYPPQGPPPEGPYGRY